LKVRVLKLGRIAHPEIKQLGEMFIKRTIPLARPVQVENVELKEDAAIDAFLAKPAGEHPLIALDEAGQEWTSVEFAGRLRNYFDDPGIKSLSFLIGAPHGLSQAQRLQAKAIWSLSKVTMTSDMAWLLLWEQIYRAINIHKGTGYHHA
jgi:23S rRNA (pseudouridine1915-N3)-methyltransferase